ncbi:MAG: HAMP domain-containing histidine kinase [Armatimonadetes bacterium]|nr:HAMP domain-containing histidine kinase [Armatimonadota bacterium]
MSSALLQKESQKPGGRALMEKEEALLRLRKIRHDLRDPLGAIMGICDLMLTRAQNQPDAEKKAREAFSNIRNLSEQVWELFQDFVKDASGTPTCDHSSQGAGASIDPWEIAEDVTLAVNSALVATGVTLDWIIPGGLVLTTNRTSLRRILTNLVTNGIKYNKPGGHVRVIFREESPAWQIFVEDTGWGMTQKECEALLSPHARQGRPPLDGSKGSGLGIAIARELSESLGGVLTVDSVPGMGTTFLVTLPRRKIAGRGVAA